MENFSRFYIIRHGYKKLMALNGIRNITLLFVDDQYSKKEFKDDPEITSIKKPEELEDFSCPLKLTNLLKSDYFDKGAVLFVAVKGKRIIASSWLHHNYDPDGDVDLIGITTYFVYGPTFVDLNYRNLGLATRLKTHACSYAKKNGCLPIYLGHEVDIIPAIKTSIKAGFKLQNMIIRTRDSEPIIL